MKAYYIQCTTWKEKKQVMFRVTNWVGFSQGLTVKRHVKGKKKCETIPGRHAHADYVKSMNGVDQNERDSCNYSTSIRTNRWYLRIFCWAMDQVVHAQHSIVIFLANQGIGKPVWKKYRDKHQGWHDFQIYLRISLLNYGIGLDWDGESRERPSYMQKGAFTPCECKMCFFCVKGLTNGITHWPSKGAKVIVEYACRIRVKTDQCTNMWVSLGMESGTYCRRCYRKQLTTELLAKERRKRCRTSAMGCPICKELICKECWKEGYDKHA